MATLKLIVNVVGEL